MARKPRRSRLDCWFSWLARKVRGRQIMPKVTRQPVNNYCGAQVAVGSFESRARILCAWLDLDFPTLSIRHLMNQLQDAEAKAKTRAEKKAVQGMYAFELLKHIGVVTKEDYDKAHPVDGQYTRNVQGLKHYRLFDYKVCPLERSLEFQFGGDNDYKGVAVAIDEIAGPIFGWFNPYTSFFRSKYSIYKSPKKPDKYNKLQPPHAVLLFGIGSRGRKTSVFAHQNNWGREYHFGGKGIIDTREFVHAVIPIVKRNWEEEEEEEEDGSLD